MILGHKRRRLVGAASLLALLGVGLAWWERPESPRAVVRPADHWSFGEGFAEGGQTFLTHGPEGTVVWETATWQPRSRWPILACRLHATDRAGRLGVGVRGHDDGNARLVVVDLSTGAVPHEVAASLPTVTQAALSDDGQQVRVVLADRQGFARAVAIWDLATGHLSETPLQGLGPGLTGPQPVAISPDGALCVRFDNRRNTMQVWDMRTDQALGGLLTATASTFVAVAALAPDGRTLLAGRQDGRIEVRDVASGQCVRTILAHPGGLAGGTLVVDQAGRTALATGWAPEVSLNLGQPVEALKRAVGLRSSNRQEVAVLDLGTGQTLVRWQGPHRAHLAADGRTVVTTEADGSLAVRDVPPLATLAHPR